MPMREDAEEVPIPDHYSPTRTNESRTIPWGRHPLEPHIRAGIESMAPSMRKQMAYFDSASAPEMAQMIERGLVTGWPWEFTKAGRAYYRRRGRKSP